MDIEKIKNRCGYSGKSQQWQYGFDLAIREMQAAKAQAQAVPEGYVVVPKEPLLKMIESASMLYPVKNIVEVRGQSNDS